MIKKIKNHFAFDKLKNSTIFLEVVIFTIIFLAIGYFVNKENPLFISTSHLNYFYILIILFSLFHGLGAGLISLFIITIFAHIYYNNAYTLRFFLDGLLINLISGEFHYYWNKKIEELSIKNDYLYTKLRELGLSSLTTKLSHDQLEKSYLSKPYTLRSILKELKNINQDDFSDLLKFLSSQFKLESFSLVIMDIKTDNIDSVHPYNMDKNDIDLKNPVISKMFETKEPVLLKNLDIKDDITLLASIPVLDNDDNIVAFLAIKDIPFLHYNAENLLSTQLILMSFFFELNKNRLMEKINNLNILPNTTLDFRYELIKLYELNKKIGLQSSVVIFNIDRNKSEVLDNFLKLNLRVLDFYQKLSGNKTDIFIVVLPLVSKSGAVGFIQRVKDNLTFIDKENLYTFFEIKNLHKIDTLIKEMVINA